MITNFKKVEMIIRNENNEEIKEVESSSSNDEAAVVNDEFSAVK